MNHAAEMNRLLRDAIAFQSISGHEGPFTRFIADWARAHDFEIDLWQSSNDDLNAHPLAQARHLPLQNRPTLLIKLPGSGDGKSLLFNAHADVVAAPHPGKWSHDPWRGTQVGNNIVGRGACDDKGPLVSALWAMLALKDDAQLRGDVLLELIPGEEDSVGIGTLTSVLRGHRADAAVVLEPTESLPRCASRGGLRFDILCLGRAVHGTVKWLGQDAIAAMRNVLGALAELERDYQSLAPDPLFASYPIARPITVDKIEGGDWQGMVADRCRCGGYFELLPADDHAAWKHKFSADLLQKLNASTQNIQITFSEDYAGHRLEPSHELCIAARDATLDATFNAGTAPFDFAAFNSGCEAGLRAALHNTPTLVWGPGSLAQAHAVDEFVDFAHVQLTAGRFRNLARRWCA